MSEFPPPQPFSPAVEKAGVGARVLARLIDAVVLLVPIMIVTVPIAGGFQIGGGNQGRDQNIATALGVIAAYIYFTVMEGTRGRTVGKGAMGITALRADGQPLNVSDAALRNSFMLVSIIPGNLGGMLSLLTWFILAVTIATEPQGRGLHDRLANATLHRNRT